MSADTWTTRTWWLVFGIAWTLLSVVQAIQIVLTMWTVGGPVHIGAILTGSITDMLAFAPALPVLRLISHRMPLERVGGWRFSAVSAGVIAVAIWISTWLMPATLALPFVPRMVFKGSMLAKQIAAGLSLALAFAVATLGQVLSRLRAHERQTLQLESSLTAARLQALQAQLQPHFLFNTLAAIAELLHDDSRAAGTMLTRLSALLRASLRSDTESQIPLREELALLDEYLGIMRVRFGPRLDVTVDVSSGLSDALVPAMLLQPLVENALEHGVSRRAGRGTVHVSIRPRDAVIDIVVRDDGPGASPDSGENGNGIGLSNTRRRLATLYGEAQSLRFESTPGLGTIVHITIPRRVIRESIA
ncbi:MAG: sensor histidine kinase [Gemmatimonadaceae bacterium]|nr:sensor histidine kinase [Gemmatimonadaceae bacterium]